MAGYQPGIVMEKFRPLSIWAILVIVLGLLLMLVNRRILPEPSVRINWEVGAHLDIQGFNIYRGSAADTNLVRVNKFIITGGEDLLSPQEFSYEDRPPNDQTEYRYIIERISTDGSVGRLEPQTYRISRNTGWIFWIGFIMLWIGLGWVLVRIKWTREAVNK